MIDAAPIACVNCGRTPTAAIELRSNTGMVLARRVSIVTGPYCRQCGLALFRRHMDHTLAWGWWGVVSFFSTFAAIARNLRSWQALRLLGPPVGHADNPPLEPGRPLVARPGAWTVAAVVLVVALVLASVTGRESEAERLEGRCVRVDTVDRRVVAVNCSDEHDGKVVDVVRGAELCPLGTTGVLHSGTDESERLCVDATK